MVHTIECGTQSEWGCKPCWGVSHNRLRDEEEHRRWRRCQQMCIQWSKDCCGSRQLVECHLKQSLEWHSKQSLEWHPESFLKCPQQMDVLNNSPRDCHESRPAICILFLIEKMAMLNQLGLRRGLMVFNKFLSCFVNSNPVGKVCQRNKYFKSFLLTFFTFKVKHHLKLSYGT